MAFQLSPGIVVTETDLTNIVPAVSQSVGAFAGAFVWGPVLDPTLISSENQLVSLFGKPTDLTFTSFFTAANFLSYSNNLQLVRIDVDGQLNATAGTDGRKVNNESDYNAVSDFTIATDGMWIAKYPGKLGNSLKVVAADSGSFSGWAYEDQFDSAPGTSTYADNYGCSEDELHILVIDEDGSFTGKPNTILEKFAYVSKASDARRFDGANNYYAKVLNDTSKYVWWAGHPADATTWGDSCEENPNTEYHTITTAIANSLNHGADLTDSPTNSDLTDGFDLFKNAELYDVSLIPTGHVNAAVSKHVIEEIAEYRKDCIVFVSPVDITSGDMIVGANKAEDTVAFRTDSSFNANSSYAFLDSGFKYQYDRYRDVYRWVPLNGDIAGLCARTDTTNNPWWSPGGLNRGQIKGVIKLSFNPDQAERDLLYKNGINPVVTFPGQGTILYGDKTLLSKPSAFDRINVRRLFITLEKSIALAARYQLFEFNDTFTRQQFVSMVEPFLRSVQGNRGIIDYRVKCDDTNNTGEVIDRNEFVADIYIKPARSINFITLNFVAVRSAVSFTEVGG